MIAASMAASMGELSIPRLGARLPLAAVNSAIQEALLMPGYEKPTGDQEEAILYFLKDMTSSFPSQTGAGKSLCFASLSFHL